MSSPEKRRITAAPRQHAFAISTRPRFCQKLYHAYLSASAQPLNDPLKLNDVDQSVEKSNETANT